MESAALGAVAELTSLYERLQRAQPPSGNGKAEQRGLLKDSALRKLADGGVKPEDATEVFQQLQTLLATKVRDATDTVIEELHRSQRAAEKLRAECRDAFEFSDKQTYELAQVTEQLQIAKRKSKDKKGLRQSLEDAEQITTEERRRVIRMGAKLLHEGRMLLESGEELVLLLGRFVEERAEHRQSLAKPQGTAGADSPTLIDPQTVVLTTEELTEDMKRALDQIRAVTDDPANTAFESATAVLPPLQRRLTPLEKKLLDRMGIAEEAVAAAAVGGRRTGAADDDEDSEEESRGFDPIAQAARPLLGWATALHGFRRHVSDLTHMEGEGNDDAASPREGKRASAGLVDKLAHQNSRLLLQMQEERQGKETYEQKWKKTFEKILEMKDKLELAHKLLQQQTVASKAAENRVQSQARKMQAMEARIVSLEKSLRGRNNELEDLRDQLDLMHEQTADLERQLPSTRGGGRQVAADDSLWRRSSDVRRQTAPLAASKARAPAAAGKAALGAVATKAAVGAVASKAAMGAVASKAAVGAVASKAAVGAVASKAAVGAVASKAAVGAVASKAAVGAVASKAAVGSAGKTGAAPGASMAAVGSSVATGPAAAAKTAKQSGSSAQQRPAAAAKAVGRQGSGQ